MQEAILRLTRFWTEQGCLLAQPFNTEVGAGTLNPATFLRVLGPEPWSTVYVEPSVRPDDSRYGDNPNRMQTHTQLQVILKPDPANSQELYLESLARIGIDTKVHDVRFVEDNWESPALGAWGLGWEVWLDGLEITQFTYFQQAGGLVLDPVSVEITYGLERILMALQGVSHFKDIAYSGSVAYGEMVGQAELEMSTYYLDQADVGAMRTLFELYETEAQRLIRERLPVPAHYYVLKCSHTFNVLDARGGVGTTERARSFRRMRTLAHDIAELWVERRDELGHPLGVVTPPLVDAPPRTAAPPEGEATFVLELGFEELPPDQVTSYASQLRDLLVACLDENRIGHGDVSTYGSPRRIIAVVAALAPRQADRTVRNKGPRVSAAFAPDGSPTRAAEGFARKHGVDVTALERDTEGGADYVFVTTNDVGRNTSEVLAEALGGVIASIAARRAMRWGAGPGYSASRALRWIVALVGSCEVGFTYADVTSGRVTRVLRNAPEPQVEVGSADELVDLLRSNGIEFDHDVRRTRIIAEAQRLAGEAGGAIDLTLDGAVVDEVANLVENPQVLMGSFAEEFLRLPPEVLTVVMKKHQRYFPIRDAKGALLPHFISVANGAVVADEVRRGNEAVLRARYADAAFFFDRDLAAPLEVHREGLAKLTFEEKVGSMLDRSERISSLSAVLADELDLDGATRAVLSRAAFLAKADLATSLVVELSSLAGQMGRIYALAGGESEEVAHAIFEGALPRFADDELPQSLPGALVSVADRADALVALFAAGAKPTGSNDPYALRRAATGLVQVISRHSLPISLRWLFEAAGRNIDLAVGEETLSELADFVATRIETRLLEEGHRLEMVKAMVPRFDRPAEMVGELAVLERIYGAPSFVAAAAAYRRVVRIAPRTEANGAGGVDESLFVEPAEAALWSVFAPLEAKLSSVGLEDFISAFAALVAPIDAFFADVMVMADDQAVRANRLAMLSRIGATGRALLDWEALPAQ